MRIRNNLDSVVYINICNRKDVKNVEYPDNYNFNGWKIEPRSVIDIDAGVEDIIFASNIPKTNMGYYILYSSNRSDKDLQYSLMDLWDNNSDIVRCQQYGKSQDVSCGDSINFMLGTKLHDLPLLRVYNNITYFIFSMVFAVAIVFAILGFVILI
jgi:hypothetical protein